MAYTIKRVSSDFVKSVLPEILRDIYYNAIIIADIIQLYNGCDFYAAFSEGKVVGLVSYYKDIPFNATGFYMVDPNSIPYILAFIKQYNKIPNNEPFFGLVNAQIRDTLEENDILLSTSTEYRFRYRSTKIKLKKLPVNIRIEKLDAEDIGEISRVYSTVPAMAWTPKSLLYGPYYGAFDGDKLVAIAGVHFNTKYIAEIGNVVSMPMYRRLGLARAVTQAVINELYTKDKTLFLCVFTQNIPAIDLYLGMGFEVTDTSYLCKFSLTSSYSTVF
ncbi:MAG: GNAT family N-acetyltransferase [candidate division Zixibacteria bacterium]|nr:GNAT family N-acetyltransferase [candidate division Zixibacteria bacterium]